MLQKIQHRKIRITFNFHNVEESEKMIQHLLTSQDLESCDIKVHDSVRLAYSHFKLETS